jgi:hypothetical protein
MPTELHSFRRLVLIAVERARPWLACRRNAELLDLDLLGLFLEDASLRDLAAFPSRANLGCSVAVGIRRPRSLMHDLEVAARAWNDRSPSGEKLSVVPSSKDARAGGRCHHVDFEYQ